MKRRCRLRYPEGRIVGCSRAKMLIVATAETALFKGVGLSTAKRHPTMSLYMEAQMYFHPFFLKAASRHYAQHSSTERNIYGSGNLARCFRVRMGRMRKRCIANLQAEPSRAQRWPVDPRVG